LDKRPELSKLLDIINADDAVWSPH
jgi:hypothetical protein